MPVTRLRLYKTLVGKPSDQNTGVPGFGKGAWAELSEASLNILQAALEAGRPLPADTLPTQRGVRTWVQEHPDELQALWSISGFFPVPDTELALGIKPGASNREAGEAIMKDFFL